MRTYLNGALLSVFLAVAHGCVTPYGNPDLPLAIHVDEHQTLIVKGEKVSVKELPDRLRSLGVGPKQQIEVRCGGDLDRDLIREITGVLASKGYRKLIFVGKRKSVSRVEPAQ